MFVVALICSKLVLVVMFLVAITQVSAPMDADLASVSDPIAFECCGAHPGARVRACRAM